MVLRFLADVILMEDYICDDRMYEIGVLLDKAVHLSDEEFEEYIKTLENEE